MKIFLKRFFSLLAAILLVIGCEPDASVEKVSPASQPRLQVLSPPQLPPAIRQQALSVSRELQKQALFSKNERSFGPVANGRIHRVHYPDGRVSYTLPLRKLGTGLYYDNLVIQQLANGTTTETLIRYEPEQAWWKNSKGIYNYATYSGRVSFYTVAGEPLASVVLQEGKIAPSPADKTGTAQRIEVSCYITDIQYAGLEQDGTFYITDIMYWFECEVYVDGNMSPDGGGYGTGGTGGGVGSAPTGEPEYAEDGGAAGSGDTPATGEEEKLVIDPSVPPCVQAIIGELMEKANLSLIPDITGDPGVSHLSEIILNLFSASQQYHLNIQVAPLGIGQNAGTIPTNINPITGEITLTMTLGSEYVANATTLAIARTIIHESLHAYLSYSYQEYPDAPFSTLLTSYFTNNGANTNEAQHLLKTQFVEAMGHSLAVWDNYSLPQSYYNSLAWSGDMQNTQAFQSLPLEQQQAAINAVIAEGQANAPATQDAQGTPCNPE